jgi:hypothetical protein
MSGEDEERYLSDGGETDADDGGFPEPGGEVVEFGWDDDRKVGGRRKKTLQKKKAKAGTFGKFAVLSYGDFIRTHAKISLEVLPPVPSPPAAAPSPCSP